jgi:uncharacterized protein (DUF1015 family)
MAVVRPFCGVRYDPTRVDLSKVIVPPYDVIAPDERASFFDRDPHNAVRFELTRRVSDEARTDYSEIAATLAEWRRSGVLVRDDRPVYYVMRQRFAAPDGQRLERIGFFGELALEDYAARVVRPHERTLAGPKADRLKLLRAVQANLSSVFLLYEDRERELAGVLAAALETGSVGEARDDADVEYTLALLDDPAAIETVRAFLESRPVVMADGHHRYESALAYRDERRAVAGNPEPATPPPSESMLAYFANAFAPGSLLLPIHRVILREPAPSYGEWCQRLGGWHSKVVSVTAAEAVPDLLAEHLAPHAGNPAFAADDGSGQLYLFFRDEPLAGELMVRVIEREALSGVFGLSPDAIREGAVSFPKSALRAARDVRTGAGRVALYLNPLSADDVFRVTGEGDVMPQKSTFFYPKIPTGLVFRVHERAQP